MKIVTLYSQKFTVFKDVYHTYEKSDTNSIKTKTGEMEVNSHYKVPHLKADCDKLTMCVINLNNLKILGE